MTMDAIEDIASVSASYDDDGTESGVAVTDEAETIGRKETRFLCAMKSVVVVILLVTASIVAAFTYRYTRKYEAAQFYILFEHEADRVLDRFQDHIAGVIGIGASFSVTYTNIAALGNLTQEFQFPYNTLPSFQVKAFEHIQFNGIAGVSFSPLLNQKTRPEWENFTQQSLITNVCSDHDIGWPNRSYTDGIYELNENNEPVRVETNSGEMSPIWQFYPTKNRRRFQFFDQYSDPVRRQALDLMVLRKAPAHSAILRVETERIFDETHDGSPKSISVVPVLDGSPERSIAGTVTVETNWTSVFRSVLKDSWSVVVVVVDNVCGDVISFKLTGQEATFLGAGDHHDYTFDKHVRVSSKQEIKTRVHALVENDSPEEYKALFNFSQQIHGQAKPQEEVACDYKISIYPTNEFQRVHATNRPTVYTISAVMIFVFAAVVFWVYDFLVERRQALVMDAAVQSRTIVDSLFPQAVRDRMFGDSKKRQRSSQETIRQRSVSPKILLEAFLKHPSANPILPSLLPYAAPIAELYLNTTVVSDQKRI